MTNPPPDPERFAAPWGIRPRRLRPDLDIPGSPERVRSRRVLEDDGGSLWILEEISPEAIAGKARQARILDHLKQAGLATVHPFLRDREDRWIAEEAGGGRMLRPYVAGIPLERPSYACEAWRGAALGTFLRSLRGASRGLPPGLPGPVFPLASFIGELQEKIRRFDPHLLPRTRPVLRFLEEHLFPVLPGLPAAFCHGDFHPLNAIWSGDALLSVIDWEFCGLKTEGHDAALLAGCIGMEDPRALAGPFVPALLGEVRRAALLSPASLRAFFALVVALRFLWLSEWLRGRDLEMAGLEADYLDLLLAGEDRIRAEWDLPSSTGGQI